MTSLFLGSSSTEDNPPPEPINGAAYLTKLHKYLQINASKLSPSGPSKHAPTILQQSYTLLTLGLDPNSVPLSRSLKVPLTLGFGQPSTSPRVQPKSIKPLLLRLPPDRLLYLLLRWQSLPQSLSHVGRTDVPIEEGVPVAARGARIDERGNRGVEGDVTSVRSWVGSMRSVSMGSLVSKESGRGWFSRKEEINEDQILLQLYSMFTLLPALLIHPPFVSEPPILELIEAGGYTQLGGIDVRVPLDVTRNLQILELEGYDPRGLLIPTNPGMRSLTVKDVQDGDDWIEELLSIPINGDNANSNQQSGPDIPISTKARFPNLHHLSLISVTLLNFPQLPLSSLTHLDLSHNLLNALPPSLAGLTSLISLNLSNNVIVSLRSASAYLPNVISLNLSGNRIDCLIGLDQCNSLQRVDIRRNELIDIGEVGRLSVLPKIKEVWCTGNGFDIAGEDEWRIQLGTLFKEERNEVRIDDTEFTWSENRRIDSLLEKRGKLNNVGNIYHSPRPSSSTGSKTPIEQTRSFVQPHSEVSHQPSASTSKEIHSRPQSNFGSVNSQFPQRLSTEPSTSIKSPSSSAAVGKKRGKRRVIRLDSTDEITTRGEVNLEDSIRGSLKLPGKVDEEVEGEGEQENSSTVDQKHEDGKPNGNGLIVPVGGSGIGIGVGKEQGQSIRVVSSKRKSNRKGLKKDTFEPIQ
ncbi:uncharacterized protein IL334_003593 [Kwoniella shivajii]|uniref:Leucine-rich repeat-containing protein 40 n=1 Tax=Kwoniella shivajii TaxID=564305 RepID=A0ABZ1CZS0_9TREE|nr:hypothetical protein IL334_003593 [Kwoniella shivajii]